MLGKVEISVLDVGRLSAWGHREAWVTHALTHPVATMRPSPSLVDTEDPPWGAEPGRDGPVTMTSTGRTRSDRASRNGARLGQVRQESAQVTKRLYCHRGQLKSANRPQETQGWL